MISLRDFSSFGRRVLIPHHDGTAQERDRRQRRRHGGALAAALLFVLVLALVSPKPSFAARTILFYEDECCRYITEGEFAVLYASALKLREPAQGWTIQSAAAALSSLGHQPQGGWVLSRFLSEAVMARLLKNSPFYRAPFTEPAFERSDLLVTIANARGALPADDGLNQGEFAVLLVEALKLQAPPAGWSMSSAIAALSAQAVPIRPVDGWKPNGPLHESEMLQILAPTRFRPTSIDPGMVVSSLQAYSLFFGRFEIATEGHFGLFVVSSLGVPAPQGGWTQKAALDYLQKRFGVQSGYGWNAHAPLCAKTFDDALRRIIEQLQPSTSASSQPVMPPAETGIAAATKLSSGLVDPATKEAPASSQNKDRDRKNAGVEDFLNSIRRNGLIPANPCTIVPAQGLLALRQREPLCADCPPPPPPTPIAPPQF